MGEHETRCDAESAPGPTSIVDSDSVMLSPLRLSCFFLDRPSRQFLKSMGLTTLPSMPGSGVDIVWTFQFQCFSWGLVKAVFAQEE